MDIPREGIVRSFFLFLLVQNAAHYRRYSGLGTLSLACLYELGVYTYFDGHFGWRDKFDRRLMQH